MQKYSSFEHAKVMAILQQLQAVLPNNQRSNKFSSPEEYRMEIHNILDRDVDPVLVGIDFSSCADLIINTDMAKSDYIKNEVQLIYAEFYACGDDMPLIKFEMRQSECICYCEPFPGEDVDKRLLEKGFDSVAEVRSEFWEYVLASFIKKVTVMVNNNIDVYADEEPKLKDNFNFKGPVETESHFKPREAGGDAREGEPYVSGSSQQEHAGSDR